MDSSAANTLQSNQHSAARALWHSPQTPPLTGFRLCSGEPVAWEETARLAVHHGKLCALSTIVSYVLLAP